MKRVLPVLVVLLSIFTVLLLTYSYPVASQSLTSQTDLNKVIQDVQKAQLAGANPDEIQKLVVQLNHVAELQNLLQTLPPENTDRRIRVLSEINSSLTTIDDEAIQLQSVASQRTSTSYVSIYSSGMVGAAVATAAYYFGCQLWRKHRIKRILRMRITAKQ